MSALEGAWSWNLGLDGHPYWDEDSASDSGPDDTETRLTYGGFIFLLQSLGIHIYSLPTFQFGMLVGKGTYFSVYRHETPLFERYPPPIGTYVAFKRMRIRDDSSGVEVSDQGQLYAMCREIQGLTHPKLREHDRIIKLQAIIWENGFGAGNESDLPMWPTLVLEYCETTLADYQLNNPPLLRDAKAKLGLKIGEGLDALHSARMFHGDLKSENVLLKIDDQGLLEPKLADFGCSVLLEKTDDRKRYWVGGTEMWCAPECPGYFKTDEEIAATDFYSMGLLMWRLNLDGKSPFEDLGIIPSGWSEGAKLKAIRFLKENDCISPLYHDSLDREAQHSFPDSIVGILRKDPQERMKALEESIRITQDATIQKLQAEKESPFSESLSEDLTTVLRKIQIRDDDASVSETDESEQDSLELFTFISSIVGQSFVLDCVKLSELSSRVALNAVTRRRLFEELMSILYEDSNYVYPQKCAGCLALTAIDTAPHGLTPESLLHELQQHIKNDTADKHTCPATFSQPDANSAESKRFYIMHLVPAKLANPAISRKGMAIYQLYLATSSGFGTQKDGIRALKILEDAVTSGYPGFFIPLCRLSSFLNHDLPPGLPFRKWLTILILFQAGIHSEAFRALKSLDPALANTVSAARSKVYNGSTASFENMKLNAIRHHNGNVIGVPPYLLLNMQGSPSVQDEYFENTLLHLVAGSEEMNTSMLEYCIFTLHIDKDVRNADGVTPLLMASRAGRGEKIMALLHLDANVNLGYVGGETPLHWLGLLPDPAPVLREFLRRGANIDAQVTHLRALPNFQDFFRGFYMYGSPLVWAMTLGSERFVDALIKEGADIHFETSTGMTPIKFACRPSASRFLTNLAMASNFKVTRECAWYVLHNWSEIGMFRTFEDCEAQGNALKIILSAANSFPDLASVEDFYCHLVYSAVEKSSFEMLEIVLRNLSCNIQAVQQAGTAAAFDARRPLSNPAWASFHFIHQAAARGDAKILTAILEYGGDMADIDGFGRSVLHTLSLYSDSTECVKALLSSGASSILDRKTPEGVTAFTFAVASCNFSVADCLLEHTPQAECQELLSSRAARQMRFPELSFFAHFIAWGAVLGDKPIEYLYSLPEVKENVDRLFSADEANGYSALMVACGMWSCGDIYDTDWFASSRQRRVMKLLLRIFPQQRHKDARDKCGNTALHVAAFVGSSEMAAALLEARFDHNPVNNWGATPLDMLFLSDPPFLLGQKGSEWNTIIQNFEKGRNEICENLRDMGATHKLPLAEEHRWTDHLPFPWVRGMRPQHP